MQSNVRQSFTRLRVAMGEKRSLADALQHLAASENQQGRTLQAIRLWGAVQHILDEFGVQPKTEFQSVLEAARQEAGDEGFYSAFEQGRALSTDAAVADALAILRTAY